MTKNLDIQRFNDEELLKKYLDTKNQELLGELLNRYISFVVLIAAKYLKDKDLAKDMAMQVFEKVIADVERFEITHFKSWLHVVTKNQCLMYLRATKGHQELSIDADFLLERHVENNLVVHHGYDEEKEQNLQELEKAVNQLDVEQKRCIELFFIEERSYKEITDMTGYSLNEVKSYIQNGKRNLRNILAKNGQVILYLLFCIHLVK